jgi:hypothetical protein
MGEDAPCYDPGMNIATRYAFVLGVVLAAGSVAAQPPAEKTTELPTMVLKVCLTLDNAKAQADLSFEFGQQPQPPRIDPKFLQEGCSPMPVIARLRSVEPSIQSYETWAPTFEPKSARIIDAKHAGVVYKVPVMLRKQNVKFFVAEMMVPTDTDDERIPKEHLGRWFKGWVEVPDEPYLSTYLARREK